MNQIRKLGTRYEKVVQRQDDRKIQRVRTSNPALSNTEFANEEQIRWAEIAHSASTRIGILMASGRFDTCFEILAEAQVEMAPKVHRPSSPISEVFGTKLANMLEEKFGCDTLLHISAFRESDLLAEKHLGPDKVRAIKITLGAVGLCLKPENES